MTTPRLTDTSVEMHLRYRELIGTLTPSERLGRALELSALTRQFSWAGARRVAGEDGPSAVRQRFLAQVYGADTAAWVARRLAAEGTPDGV